MTKFLFKYYYKHLIFSNSLMIILFVLLDYEIESKLDFLSFLYLFFLCPFFCNTINSENMWNSKINHLCSISIGRLLFSSNIVNVAFTLFSFALYLLIEIFQVPDFDFIGNLSSFSIKLLIAVLIGNFISLHLSPYFKIFLFKFLFSLLFITLLTMLFGLIQYLNLNPNIIIIALLFTVITFNFSQHKKIFYYYDFN